MYRRSLAVAARAFTRAPTSAPLAVVARAVGTSAPTDAPVALRKDAATVAEPPLSPATVAAIACEARFGAHNYASVPVVVARAKGVHVWDVDGKCYLDALSGYSAVNQGHAHPKIVAALSQQAATLGLVSRAFHSAPFGEYAEAITTLFGYDKARAARRGGYTRVASARCPLLTHSALLQVLPANTGVETGETAVKLVRRWCGQRRCKHPTACFRAPAGATFVPPTANKMPRRESSGPTA